MKILYSSVTAMFLVACGSNSDSSGDDNPGLVLTGQLSLNSVPSLSEAAGTAAEANLALLLNEAPNFTQLQEDFDTLEKRKEVFGETENAKNFCDAIQGTARSLSKFLSEDSNLCTFREVDKAYQDGETYITLEDGDVGEEGIFGQADQDKKIQVNAQTPDGTMNVYFDIPGTATSADTYQLTMRMCVGGELQSIQRVQIERETAQVSITQYAAAEEFGSDGEGAYHSMFVGYLQVDGSGWDLGKKRTYRLEHANEERYESLWTDFTEDNQIATLSTGISDSWTSRDWYAVSVAGSSAETLAVTGAQIKQEAGESESTEIGMVYKEGKYELEESGVLVALLEALPTAGRYFERDGEIESSLADGADCEMEEVNAVFSLDMAVAFEEIDAVCSGILHDSQDREVEGKTPVRDGPYCEGL